jgi:fructose-bisphosphate aldolase class I
MPNVDYLISRRIIPGIKVDQGLEKFENSEETWTKGLNDLPERLREYYGMGLRFAKWRAAFNLTLDENGEVLTPTEHAISENCMILAEYAKDCQSAGLVPIVEPEVVYDGYYPIERNIEVTSRILDCLFDELENFEVKLEACVLKVNMVLAGKKFETQSTPEEVGKATADVLKNHVPEKLAGVVFLSGGQMVEQATANLGEVIKNGPFPWPVTFSFARALQDPALYAWHGDINNAEEAKRAFKERLIENTKVL